jgi:hypothetical protein
LIWTQWTWKPSPRSIGFDADENGQSRQVQHLITIHPVQQFHWHAAYSVVLRYLSRFSPGALLLLLRAHPPRPLFLAGKGSTKKKSPVASGLALGNVCVGVGVVEVAVKCKRYTSEILEEKETLLHGRKAWKRGLNWRFTNTHIKFAWHLRLKPQRRPIWKKGDIPITQIDDEVKFVGEDRLQSNF